MASPSLAWMRNPFRHNASRNATDRKSRPSRESFEPPRKKILTLSAYRIDYVAHDLDPTASVAVSKALEAQVCLTSTKLIGRMNTAATIKIHVPSPLRGYCAGRSELAIPATTVRAALEELERRYPALHRGICDETGSVRRHINL